MALLRLKRFGEATQLVAKYPSILARGVHSILLLDAFELAEYGRREKLANLVESQNQRTGEFDKLSTNDARAMFEALDAISKGNKAQASAALGSQDLHYQIWAYREWVPFAKALFFIADPSGRDLVHVLESELAGAGAITVTSLTPEFLWRLNEIVSLQMAETERRRDTMRRIKAYQAATVALDKILWGL